jgi:3,4-dihydroxy 2-butanone 4-phosphate synthase/GTP cyclohydrolase II
MTTAPTPEIVAELKAGRMVILVDEEDRENEGDLVLAAEFVTPEAINFMARHARGLVCLTLTEERCRALGLAPMVAQNRSNTGTNFTVSIEAAEGVTTGISAADRARTVRVAIAPDSRPEDLVQPGHIFPVVAQPGGVLSRAGHTEAGCDLVRLSGLEPAAVIVEILNEDGTMARRPQLEEFAAQHGLKLGTIADLIRYRLEKERSVERIAERDITTDFGSFRLCCYEDHVNGTVHLALVRGRLDRTATPLVRVHLNDTVRDLVGAHEHGLSWSLRSALERIAREGDGVVVLLRPHESPLEIAEAVRSGNRTPANPRARGAQVLRTYGIGAQILRDLGVARMRVLSAPKQMHGLSAFGLEVVEYVDAGS